MTFDKETYEYLSGRKFSNGLYVNIQDHKYPLSRIEFIKQIVRKKSVLHLGCSDHVELIEKKISQDQWLHKIIEEQSSFFNHGDSPLGECKEYG